MTRIYLDTAPVICTVEHIAPSAAAVDARLAGAGVVRVASELTRMECRVRALRAGDQGLLADYDLFFAGAVAEMVSLTRSVLDRAAEIRADHGYRTRDALHLAAALESGAAVFLTHDHRLAGFPGLAIEVV